MRALTHSCRGAVTLSNHSGYVLVLLFLVAGVTPGTAQVRSNRPSPRSPSAGVVNYRSASFPVARGAAAALGRASEGTWSTIVGAAEESEDGGGFGWSIRDLMAREEGNTTLRYRVASYSEGGDCFVQWSALLRNGGLVLVDTWEGCVVEAFPNTFKRDSLFLEPGQAPAAFHFDETNHGVKPGTDEFRWTTAVKPIPEGAKIARLQEGARAILAADTVALKRVFFGLHP